MYVNSSPYLFASIAFSPYRSYHFKEAVKFYQEWGSSERADLVLSRPELRNIGQTDIKVALGSSEDVENESNTTPPQIPCSS